MKQNPKTGFSKWEDLQARTDLMVKEIVEEKKTKVWVILLAIIGVILIGCIVGYFLYRRFKPDYLEDFEDEFEDDDPFEDDDDFFFTDPEES